MVLQDVYNHAQIDNKKPSVLPLAHGYIHWTLSFVHKILLFIQ